MDFENYSEIRATLFDADGVLTLAEEFFSQTYARSRGMDPKSFDQFFKEQFPAARLGRADLKELIAKNQDIWQWDGQLDDLLAQWFKSEDVRNQPLLDYIQTVRAKGIPCYVATNQEKYRGEYIKSVMFAGQFDGYFISADMGTAKPEPSFFRAIIESLQAQDSTLKAENIAFFDDTQNHVDAAASLGLAASLYTSLDDVKAVFENSR